MIPCKECLLLAACRHKKSVECKLLSDWLTLNNDNRILTNKKRLTDVKKCFPDVTFFGRATPYEKDTVYFNRYRSSYKEGRNESL